MLSMRSLEAADQADVSKAALITCKGKVMCQIRSRFDITITYRRQPTDTSLIDDNYEWRR